MISISLLLLLTALIGTIASAMGRCPVWIPVLLVVITLLIGILPR